MTISNTMKTFGYPETLICEYDHWVVLLRPKQATLGALVLAAKSDAKKSSDLPAAAFGELAQINSDIEAALGDFVSFEKINYLMLMMVDPEVHYHVIPRMSEERIFEGVTFPDLGWPALPNLAEAPDLAPEIFQKVQEALKARWANRV